MKCYKHNKLDAVATCNNCGKGLCNECSDEFQPISCQRCALQNNETFKSGLMVQLIVPIVIFISIFVFSLVFMFSALKSLDDSIGPLSYLLFFIGVLINSYAIATVPFGWRFLNKLTPDVFLFLPIAGWLFYFGVKFAISLSLGWIIAPFAVWRIKKDLKSINLTKQDVLMGRGVI
ncbi:hypothetical protein [Sporosarcina highlanderae]|uniref:B box-type domain-containing protein n=1 Tax=Sporosarcina highlanderae TaxID=3035916 RepID=A0ABT8JLF7_9BACL|nr:hypothetical protein [Sporosarcina highlanderae]MDN4605877.1 hypothetical protein [Sporosarcina highlanderae]